MAQSAWLREVEEDAMRITNKRFNDYFEEQQYQNEKKAEVNTKVKTATKGDK